MNYLILNGTNSNTIPGLIISSLPPITKPEMRVAIDEIDGKDGDQITKLGYSANDKEIEIGLSYNYDVNQVLAFFNTEGIVTFSNEPDKYYRYTIVDQIDLERLIRFKTAKVTMHVQPFKYELTEEEKKITTTETAFEGTNIEITGSEFGGLITEQKHKGQTEQRTTIGYNMLPPGEAGSHTVNGLTHISDGKGTYTLSGTASSASGQNWAVEPYTIKSGDYLYLCNSATNSNVTFALLTDENTQIMYTGPSTANRIVSLSAYAGQTINYVRTRSATQTLNNFKMSPMICDTTTRATFEEFTDGPAPNPSYPQEVKVTRGSQKIALMNKNLIEETFKGYNINARGQFETGGTSLDFDVQIARVVAGATYTITPATNVIAYFDGKPTTSSQSYNGAREVITNTNTLTPTRSGYIAIRTPTTNTAQLEKGTTATSYVPHYEQEYPLDLPVENLLQNTATSGSSNGITWTKNSDGTINVDGTATADVSFYVTASLTFASGSYILSGCPKGGSTTTYSMVLEGTARDTGDGKTFTTTTNKRVAIEIKSGTTCNNLLFKPQIETRRHS